MKILSTVIFIILTLLSLPSFSSDISLKTLAKNSYWLQLGHYRSAVLTEWKSEVDSESFFLTKSGKTDPYAELLATVDSFNAIGLTVNEANKLRCAFPARYTWLKKKIPNNWPELNCIELSQWKEVMNPAGITLVFPTAFMNSPSSMFGHTLLRVDAKDQNRHRELVAFAINFSAQPDVEDNAAAYAFKGLVGQYPGNFTVMPYYRKVREYNDIESRDIWEYKLNFTEREVERILLHLWELQRATFDYYFIDENCSYQLLSLLQLANEKLDLTSSFSFQAIPSDTVAALKNNKLLQEPNYRPAFGTRLYHYAQQLSAQELASVQQLIEEGEFDNATYTIDRQAAILEMAYEWLNFNFYDQGLNRDLIAPRLKKLLYERSKLKTPPPFSEPEKPLASPEQGHSSSRVGITLVNSNNYDNQIELSYRLAYHDLLDYSLGYIPGAQISFFDFQSSFSKNDKLRIEHLYLIDAMSLAPDNEVFNSWSWNMRLGYDRQPDINKQKSRYFTQGGYGKSFGDPNKFHSFILGSVEFNAGDIADNVEVGLGTELGAVWQLNSNNKLAFTGNVMWLLNSEVARHSRVDLSWNWALQTNWALRSNINYKKWYREETQAKLTLYYYF
ncbi:DUF4105 domain-containing protein [Colwellia sp. D2M02]|uniref:Lnb N-terminal periplasmic domain-containing protein n=1 Tax=Colwellia sp. D2M02 TaxID=2841562 RepID=UPI001C09EF61|nr:DUF4105 domain-containing protein [Colwellia sp. D2M02]MBU2894354.1 DUF4105 domain-containing protein [Colwellia sp. D2M02]